MKNRLFLSRKMQFLLSLKKEVEGLPWKIWDYEDCNDENYPNKHKMLKGKVMHIENKINSYISKKYVGNRHLQEEFSHYSFFPKNSYYDQFFEENNKIWKRGKMDYLYFLDKLIDYSEAEDTVEGEDFKKRTVKLTILVVIIGISVYFLFFSHAITLVDNLYIKQKMQVLFVLLFVSITVLWRKNWRELLPITTGLIGAFLGLQA